MAVAAFDKHDKVSLTLDNVDKNNHMQLQAVHLLGYPHLMAAVSGAGRHMPTAQAAAWGLAGFSIEGHDSPAQNHAAIQHGHDVASRVNSTTVASEADLAAALSAYGDIHGNLLTNPEGSYAQANLAGAIQTAQNKLDLQRAASTNGTGDNASSVQTQFRTPAEYQAFVQQQADLKNRTEGSDMRTVAMNSSQRFDRRVISTVGNSTVDVVNGSASYNEANGVEQKEVLKPVAA